MNDVLKYFSDRVLIAHVLLFGLIGAALILWPKVGKEEMPEFAFNFVRITIPFPGASAEDVELLITKPVEEKLKGLSSLERIKSTSSYGLSSFAIDFELRAPDLQERIQEVKDAVESVAMPRDAEEARYFQFRSSEKAILDVGLYLDDKEILDTQSRQSLQSFALAFKDRLLSLKEVSGVTDAGYLRPEIHVLADPVALKENEISMAQVEEQIRKQHLRQPLGSMSDRLETDVSLIGELETAEDLKQVYISKGFEGYSIQLKDLADVKDGFERKSEVSKMSGREGIMYNIKKSTSADILTAQKKVMEFVENFRQENEAAGLRLLVMDDESYDVRNRLSLIGNNGLIGFVLILIVLFLFLDFRAGVWVALGIPFCLAFTLIGAAVFGFSVNNMTLAAIIIVLGIVVDDAIIVAENISRREMKGMPSPYVQGTREVMSPVIASVLTTCAAFVPLYFFSGRFGLFVLYIPTVVFLMLLASLLESFFILPAHMRQSIKVSFFEKPLDALNTKRQNLLDALEANFAMLLEKVLSFRVVVLTIFCGLLAGAYYVYDEQLSYVLFPREESKDFRVKVKLPEGTVRYETAKKIREVEDIFMRDEYDVVVGVRSTVAQSRRGGQVNENEASLIVEVIPRDERDITLNELFDIWQAEIDKLEGFTQVRMLKGRWGSDSGSPIEVQIQENNDELRQAISEALKEKLESHESVSEVEIERPLQKPEYELTVLKGEVSRLDVDHQQLASTLRAYLEGNILYTINSGEEEVDLRFSSLDSETANIDDLMNLTVVNRSGYLIPVKHLVEVALTSKPANIQRINFKRTNSVYADLKEDTLTTPLQIADWLEQEVFPELNKGNPSVVFQFEGEIKDSRESKGDFAVAISIAMLLILFLLVFLFESLVVPLLIIAIIPFGMVGVVFMFWSHGMAQFGFFAVVGALGMIGVVLNDSIVLVDKLEKNLEEGEGLSRKSYVAQMSATRIRAVILTTLTTVAGLVPTAYGLAGYDAMLAEMMLSMAWGLIFGMFITLFLTPTLYSVYLQISPKGKKFAS